MNAKELHSIYGGVNIKINPIHLDGTWTDGWALDRHTISSEYIGDDPFGHPRFDTVRSEIGELVYQLKYQMNMNSISLIVDELSRFLMEKGIIPSADIILPVPPSKYRQIQPVFAIADATAKMNNMFYSDDVLRKISSDQAKSMNPEQKNSLKNSVVLIKQAKRPCNVLLIDDIYETGSTLNECVRALRTDKNIKDIFVVTMTKTKIGG